MIMKMQNNFFQSDSETNKSESSSIQGLDLEDHGSKPHVTIATKTNNAGNKPTMPSKQPSKTSTGKCPRKGRGKNSGRGSVENTIFRQRGSASSLQLFFGGVVQVY